MLFNSINFLIFLLVVVVLYWTLKQKYRWILLLITSYFFYAAWEPVYILLIAFSTGIDYFISNKWTSSANKKIAKRGLAISILMNLTLLFSFKYYNFFQESLQFFLAQFDVNYHYSKSNLLLPVGISFYTFQTISYSVDVYRKIIPPEKHLGKFALFVAFFPQLVAGPIERAKDLLPQLNNLNIKPKWEYFQNGGRLILYGLFKKVVIADNCAHWVDNYYLNYESQNGGTLLFAAVLFSIQAYGDFSGYSNIAIGTARCMGIKLHTNFNTPFFSKSITKLWQNWHISLSYWLRDYVYIPLGGNRKGKLRATLNTFITMLVSGIWHGASINFVIWGGLNGLGLIFEKFTGIGRANYSSKLLRFVMAIYTFLFFTFSAIFFRSTTFEQATSILCKISTFSFFDLYFIVGDNKFTPAVLCTIIFFFIEILLPFQPFTNVKKFAWPIRYLIYFVLIFCILLFGVSTGTPYIYFQF